MSAPLIKQTDDITFNGLLYVITVVPSNYISVYLEYVLHYSSRGINGSQDYGDMYVNNLDLKYYLKETEHKKTTLLRLNLADRCAVLYITG